MQFSKVCSNFLIWYCKNEIEIYNLQTHHDKITDLFFSVSSINLSTFAQDIYTIFSFSWNNSKDASTLEVFAKLRFSSKSSSLLAIRLFMIVNILTYIIFFIGSINTAYWNKNPSNWGGICDWNMFFKNQSLARKLKDLPKNTLGYQCCFYSTNAVTIIVRKPYLRDRESSNFVAKCKPSAC